MPDPSTLSPLAADLRFGGVSPTPYAPYGPLINANQAAPATQEEMAVQGIPLPGYSKAAFLLIPDGAATHFTIHYGRIVSIRRPDGTSEYAYVEDGSDAITGPSASLNHRFLVDTDGNKVHAWIDGLIGGTVNLYVAGINR